MENHPIGGPTVPQRAFCEPPGPLGSHKEHHSRAGRCKISPTTARPGIRKEYYSQCCSRYLSIKSVADQKRLLQPFSAATRLRPPQGDLSKSLRNLRQDGVAQGSRGNIPHSSLPTQRQTQALRLRKIIGLR